MRYRSGLLRLGWFAKHGWVQLVPRDLAVQQGLDLTAAFAWDRPLRCPLLDGLWGQPEKIAESGLATGEANCFGDSVFHDVRSSRWLQL